MGAGNLCLISWVILTKETQAASSRILTKRSSNCSTTNSHKDFPETDKNTSHTWTHETERCTLCLQRKRAERCSSVYLQGSEGGKILLKTLPQVEKGGGEKTGKINIYLLLLAALQIQHQGGGRVIRLAGVYNTERMEKGKEHSIKTNWLWAPLQCPTYTRFNITMDIYCIIFTVFNVIKITLVDLINQHDINSHFEQLK